ncbi:MAG: hypothetical protein IKT33_01335 [Clostridia bacterium]|nr:hypothetical protein [Clostridia bacterium]
MAYTSKKELYDEVARLNEKYCKNTKNHLRVGSAYNGYRVELTGKTYERNGHKKWRGIGSGADSVTHGYLSPKETLGSLYRAESKGWLKSQIKHWEKCR